MRDTSRRLGLGVILVAFAGSCGSAVDSSARGASPTAAPLTGGPTTVMPASGTPAGGAATQGLVGTRFRFLRDGRDKEQPKPGQEPPDSLQLPDGAYGVGGGLIGHVTDNGNTPAFGYQVVEFNYPFPPVDAPPRARTIDILMTRFVAEPALPPTAEGNPPPLWQITDERSDTLTADEELSGNVTEAGCQLNGTPDPEVLAVVTGWKRTEAKPGADLTVARAYRLSRPSGRIQLLPDVRGVRCTLYAPDGS